MELKELQELVSRIGVTIKNLQKCHENCIESIDCQCLSCMQGCSMKRKEDNCVRSVDCQCEFCLDDYSRKMDDEEKQVEVIESMVESAKQEDHSSEGSHRAKMDNDLNKCVEVGACQKIPLCVALAIRKDRLQERDVEMVLKRSKMFAVQLTSQLNSQCIQKDGFVDEGAEQKLFDRSPQRGAMGMEMYIVPQSSPTNQVNLTALASKDTAQINLAMTSIGVVKYKGLLVALSMVIEDTQSLLRGIQKIILHVVIGIMGFCVSLSLTVTKVTVFEYENHFIEVVVETEVAATKRQGALRLKNNFTLQLELRGMLKKLHEQGSSIQLVFILSCTIPAVTFSNNLALFTIVRAWGIDNVLMCHEQSMEHAYLIFSMHEFIKIQNIRDKRAIQRLYGKAFFNLVDLDNLVRLILLVLWAMEVESNGEFKFQFLNLLFNNGCIFRTLVGLELLLQAPNGFIIEVFIEFYYYRSLVKGTKEGEATVFENLSCFNDVYYMLGSLETLELYKMGGNANQREVAESYGGMFPIGESFKEGVQLIMKNTTGMLLIWH